MAYILQYLLQEQGARLSSGHRTLPEKLILSAPQSSWGIIEKLQKYHCCRIIHFFNSSEADCERCCLWCLWPSVHEKKIIPKDVPKGHLVVYVGEYHKRFVIKITLLKHPLFQALLDHAQEVYDFDTSSKLCIPCDENIFQSVVRCATSPKDPRMCIRL